MITYSVYFKKCIDTCRVICFFIEATDIKIKIELIIYKPMEKRVISNRENAEILKAKRYGECKIPMYNNKNKNEAHGATVELKASAQQRKWFKKPNKAMKR